MTAETAHVRLIAHTSVAFGEEVLLCGSSASLGSWNLADAAAMQCEDGGKTWSLDTTFPSGVQVELKVVTRQQGGLVRWHGAGNSGNDNIVLQTTLARAGAMPSQFLKVEGLPFPLEVQDLSPEEVQEKSAGAVSALSQRPATAGTGRSMGGSEAEGYAQHHRSGCAATGASPAISADIASLMLAGHMAAAGQAVTVHTTTTTVTINGGGGFGVPAAAGPVPLMFPSSHPQQVYNAHQAGNAVADGAVHPESAGNCQKALPSQDSAADEKRRSQDANSAMPRAGPLPLRWQHQQGDSDVADPPAQDVRVRGSWDLWKDDVVLEPCAGGEFRAMLVLPPGEYEFKFIVDGKWTTSQDYEESKCMNKNNIQQVQPIILVPVPLGVAAASRPAALEDSKPS
eukprot:TRINITY_DN31863_c0_g1_i1.p1 TRINITY_DN31863_c0_g1~~TRINITY_DN31863_c0_g1_i1.p1  ORF type:complete len:409 (+),score=105.29 TRINITY_DN31863_c0_g1_i1:36-1229(+)